MKIEIIQVNSILHAKLELTHCVPKLKRIGQLLEENPYRGHFDDGNDDEEHPRRKVFRSMDMSDKGMKSFSLDYHARFEK